MSALERCRRVDWVQPSPGFATSSRATSFRLRSNASSTRSRERGQCPTKPLKRHSGISHQKEVAPEPAESRSQQQGRPKPRCAMLRHDDPLRTAFGEADTACSTHPNDPRPEKSYPERRSATTSTSLLQARRMSEFAPIMRLRSEGGLPLIAKQRVDGSEYPRVMVATSVRGKNRSFTRRLIAFRLSSDAN